MYFLWFSGSFVRFKIEKPNRITTLNRFNSSISYTTHVAFIHSLLYWNAFKSTTAPATTTENEQRRRNTRAVWNRHNQSIANKNEQHWKWTRTSVILNLAANNEHKGLASEQSKRRRNVYVACAYGVYGFCARKQQLHYKQLWITS